MVRVRFAPSPTGFFHIGSARTALFNWLYARRTQGSFVLRIEDTDKERNTPEALRVLIEGMRWLGLNWDEGPEIEGNYGPYFQSERKAIYEQAIQKLLDTKRAYEKDGAIYFKLLGERYTEYDAFKKCEVEKVKTEPTVINDLVRGKVVRQEERDFVIVRNNGEPVFHLVNVVDDLEMGITHVIRGEDHLSNTSKHVELFKALDAPLPTFAHIPLILKSSGPGKMSKRDRGALIEEYQKRDFLPEAVRNYLCLLGWSPGDDKEVLPIETIISLFDLPAINKNNARFDEKKLSFINADYLRSLEPETFVSKAKAVLEAANVIDSETDPIYLKAVMAIVQEKVRSLEDLPSFCRYCFKDDFAIDPKAQKKVFKKGDPLARLQELLTAIKTLDTFTASSLETLIQSLAKTDELSTGEYIHPTRLAISGMAVGPSFYQLLEVLGKDRIIPRLERFIESQ